MAFYGGRLTIARESRGLTVEELAEKLSVPAGRVRAWESGTGTPTTATYDRLRFALSYPVAFYRDPPPEPLGFTTLDLHGYEYLCDQCDHVIDPIMVERIADQDFHPWCLPGAPR